MTAPPILPAAELAACQDPDVLFERAWALEPPMRLSERTAVLERISELLAAGAPAPPPGRDWGLELSAERAIDAAISTPTSTTAGLGDALALADQVLAQAAPEHLIARGRATFARGRALAWLGTDDATRQAERALIDAAGHFHMLGRTDWEGFAVFWRGYSVHFESGGALLPAIELMREALSILAPDSPRRSTILDFYGDALIELGDVPAAREALAQAEALADDAGDGKSSAFIRWSRAHLSASVGDAPATERLLREVERDAGDWFDTHIGAAFLGDAADLLDRVGLEDQAEAYLLKATARVGVDDETVRQVRALMLARGGDPGQALDALQELTRGDWLEKRFVWRFTLLTAWATFRAGRGGAGELTDRAITQAIARGGIRVAQAGEPELLTALAPLAAQTGCAPARALLLQGRTLIVRLFGTPSVTNADGIPVELPVGMPGELVRMLAVHPHGLPVDVVLDAFFPDVPASAARQRLRQVLTRLRSAAGEVVVRDGEHLRLVSAWVDVLEFQALAGRVRSASGPRAVQLAYAALALCDGPLLPTDRYAEWTQEIRSDVEYRHLGLLELIATTAAQRGSHQEALTALEALLAGAPEDPRYLAAASEQLRALGRPETARRIARRLSD